MSGVAAILSPLAGYDSYTGRSSHEPSTAVGTVRPR